MITSQAIDVSRSTIIARIVVGAQGCGGCREAVISQINDHPRVNDDCSLTAAATLAHPRYA
ncbi:MAG: hypothetical protein GY832_24615 [Chloroflexi bacterium]|nr:hypothetical protein [Chloroflexota bacterium]